jgi:hypothetical protein
MIGTDEELGDVLGISIHAVKMRWPVIYNLPARYLPELFGDTLHWDRETHRRGREKKQRLLDYVREHPEELHPVSRKLLLQESTQLVSTRPARLRRAH